jgi:hypothetical protein
MAELLRVEGYFQGHVDWGVDIGLMATTIRALAEANLSTAFAFLYDEFWLPYFRLHRIYTDLLGADYRMLPCFWAWNIDPKRGEAGWKPHRDRNYTALSSDGAPVSLTTWIPLSSATPLNGCMYVVPAHLDPTYATPNDDQWNFEHSSIRALPAVPGDFFIWNQALLHWGSTSSPRASESRVSMSVEFQRIDVAPYDEPLMPPLTIFPFELRLKLIARQILQYRHMYKVDEETEQMALELVA